MSSKNNVNPDHYKVAGRDRQNSDVVRGRVNSRLAGRADFKPIPKPPRPASKSQAAEPAAAKPQSEEKTREDS